MTNFKEDQGEDFGTWNDPVSNELYVTSTKEILSLLNIPDNVGDLGGANGNLKQFIPYATTVDIDESKNPDIVDNILTHSTHYKLVVLRYVLHYLTDVEVIKLFHTINADRILVIQFTNEDLRSKYANSINETKYFRTYTQLRNLLPQCLTIYSKRIEVTSEFYLNRLNNPHGLNHEEDINAFIINR